MRTRTLLLVAALGCGELANAFLAAVLCQLCVGPGARCGAAAARLVAFVPRVVAPNAVDWRNKE